jgi:uncharacterized protein (DUF39 family)
MRDMAPRFLRAASLTGYAASLSLGVGVPIPVLDEEIMAAAAVSDEDITYPVVEYSESYPLGRQGNLGRVTMAELMSGQIEVGGKRVPTGSLASRVQGRAIAQELKAQIEAGRFLLTRPVAPLPGAELAQA